MILAWFDFRQSKMHKRYTHFGCDNVQKGEWKKVGEREGNVWLWKGDTVCAVPAMRIMSFTLTLSRRLNAVSLLFLRIHTQYAVSPMPHAPKLE